MIKITPLNAPLSLKQWVLVCLLGASLSQWIHAGTEAQAEFKPMAMQFIAALGDPESNSGEGAQEWGLWTKDPGPRGVWLKHFKLLKSMGGHGPNNWLFNDNDWWLDENGILMEHPDFPLRAGKYLVTGGREVTTVLTIYPKAEDGSQRWELEDDEAVLADVTHLPCRSARFTPAEEGGACTPANVPVVAFPISPGGVLPEVAACKKQDYAVLLVISALN